MFLPSGLLRMIYQSRAKTWDAIDEAIRVREKLLLILSSNSINSDWVEDEVSKALAEERHRKLLVLFPVRTRARYP
jgi:hypothetical protein